MHFALLNLSIHFSDQAYWDHLEVHHHLPLFWFFFIPLSHLIEERRQVPMSFSSCLSYILKVVHVLYRRSGKRRGDAAMSPAATMFSIIVNFWVARPIFVILYASICSYAIACTQVRSIISTLYSCQLGCTTFMIVSLDSWIWKT